MLYYSRVDVPERIGVNKTSASKECIVCHYWYFLDKAFTFQLSACNYYHDVLMMSININTTAIFMVLIVIVLLLQLKKSGAINLSENVDLVEKSDPL